MRYHFPTRQFVSDPSVTRPFRERDGVRKSKVSMLLRDGFRDRVLKPLTGKNELGGLFSYADFTPESEAKRASFWNDEIHPAEAGFAILAQTLNQELRSCLPVAKQGAVT